MSSTNPTTINAPEGTPYVEIIREFDAPVEALFRAHTDPELFGQWMGPRNLETREVNLDARTGGSYRFVHGDEKGDYAFRGVFHTVIPNELVIQTFEFEGMPNHVSLETAKFEDIGNGRSRLTGLSVLQSVEDRDGMVSMGMETGIVEGYEKLDELLAAGI